MLISRSRPWSDANDAASSQSVAQDFVELLKILNFTTMSPPIESYRHAWRGFRFPVADSRDKTSKTARTGNGERVNSPREIDPPRSSDWEGRHAPGDVTGPRRGAQPRRPARRARRRR